MYFGKENCLIVFNRVFLYMLDVECVQSPFRHLSEETHCCLFACFEKCFNPYRRLKVSELREGHLPFLLFSIYCPNSTLDLQKIGIQKWTLMYKLKLDIMAITIKIKSKSCSTKQKKKKNRELTVERRSPLCGHGARQRGGSVEEAGDKVENS